MSSTEMKHTPGPWYMSGEDGVLVANNSEAVARVYRHRTTGADNARLIAAAPDMLAALRFFVETDDVEAALETARAALSKAERG